jgi:hypothetical protein
VSDNLQKVDVCVFVHKDIQVNKIDFSNNCEEKDLEICAFEVETEACESYYVYREPPPQDILIYLLEL